MDYKRIMSKLIMCSIIMIFIIGFLMMTPKIIKQLYKGFERELETREILSLNVGTNTIASGTAFYIGIGFGTYSSKNVKEYYMFIKGSEGYILTTIRADTVELVETDEKDPCIKGVFINDLLSSGYKSTAYIPVGTIVIEYKLDLD